MRFQHSRLGRGPQFAHRISMGRCHADIVNTQTIELIDLSPDMIVTPHIMLGPIEPQHMLCSQGQLL